MSNQKKNSHNESPRQELSPKVREAVESVLKNPMPEALTSRVLKAAQTQVREYPREAKTKRRRIVRTVLATAASIALMVTAAYFYTVFHAFLLDFHTVQPDASQTNRKSVGNSSLVDCPLESNIALADLSPSSKSENREKESAGDEFYREEPQFGNSSALLVYSLAARQSPETFDALLERQAWQSDSAKQRAALKRLADLL
jgi:hypothetical protein